MAALYMSMVAAMTEGHSFRTSAGKGALVRCHVRMLEKMALSDASATWNGDLKGQLSGRKG